jgi:hypothetical protein
MSNFILCVVVVVAMLSAIAQAHSAWNQTQAEISLWLSAAASCGWDKVQSHTFKGPSTGFVVTQVLHNPSKDTQGYVGYLPSDQSIYITFRGSESIKNWISNLDALKASYSSWPECNCEVHKGFYAAEQAIFPTVLSAVKSLKTKFPNYKIKLTGHSLGAALAQLTSMDLVKNGFAVDGVLNFGQPRTGDKAYAHFATGKVDTWRVVHDRDTVPHLPLNAGMDFYHVCQEQFEDKNHNLKTCDTSCEDPTCADQYGPAQWNGDDHLVYLGMSVSCEAVSR